MMKRLTAAALAACILACSPAADGKTGPDGEKRTSAAERSGPAPIPSRLLGTEWRLTHFDRSEAVPESITITIKFEADKLSGSAGCNNYFASIIEGDRPGELTIGPTGTTRMACPEETLNAERRFLEALANVVRYEMGDERLAITYREEGKRRMMLLKPVGAGS